MDTPSEKETTQNETQNTQTVVQGTISETITVAELPHVAQESFFARNKSTFIAVIIALILLGGAGHYLYTTKYADPAVAVVNGMKISQTQFDESVMLIEQNAVLQGFDLADEASRIEIRNQALDTLINNALIITAAEKAGIGATDQEIQTKYDELATQLGGAEALNTRMAEIGLSESKLRSNIEERIIADAYIEGETDIENITIDAAEIAAYMEALKKNNPAGGELPPLDEIKPQIEAQLKAEKQQQIVTDLIARLRNEAKIEVKI